ncbi:MAG: encapsulin [Gemmatimonadetes bacterium]|nr:encapsulin [Gemmatimonadota bacterium]
MSDDTARLPWSTEQWAALRSVVQESARKARVASSFLPLYGPLPRDQVTVPALTMESPELGDRQRGEPPARLEINDAETLRLTTIAADVYLKTAEAADPDLEAAKAMVGRAADVLGRLEDAIVFNGQPEAAQAPVREDGSPFVVPVIYTVRGGQQHPGLLDTELEVAVPFRELDGRSETLVSGVVEAIEELEGRGHYGPFACVLGHELFRAANTPNRNSLVLPSDRILPFLEGPLLRSSTLPANRGVVVALSGSPIDLVVATDLDVQFVQLTLEPRYVLRVSERFVLRMKEPDAVCRLVAEPASGDRG